MVTHYLYAFTLHSVFGRYNLSWKQGNIFAARCYAITAYVVMRCLSVRVSVTFVNSVKTNKLIFKFFSPLGSQAILILSYRTAWQYSDGNLHNGGVECRWGRQKSWFSAYIWLHCMLSMLRPARSYQHGAAWSRSHKLWHLSLAVSGGVCWWREMTKCLWQEVTTLCQRQQNSI